MEEFGLFTLEGVADKLKYPSSHEDSRGVGPQLVKEDAGNKECQRNHDERNTQRMAEPVDWMLMAAGILGNPLTIRTSA